MSFNDYLIVVPTNSTGYLLTDLLATINAQIQVANLTYSLSENRDDLNVPSTTMALDQATNYLDMNVDLTRVFRTPFYSVQSTHSFLGNIQTLDMSQNVQIITSQFNISSAYTLSPSDVITITPQLSKRFVNPNNIQAATFVIAPTDTYEFKNFNELQDQINRLFTTYKDSMNDYPLSNTYVIFDVVGTKIVSRLYLNVNKTITQLNYTLEFVDTTGGDFWNKSLYFDASYVIRDFPLTGAVSIIPNRQQLSDNQILVETNINDEFFLKPYPDINGLNPVTRNYDISIRIPDGTYSRNTLYSKINELLTANPLCKGSSIQVYTSNTREYTAFRFNINRIFSTIDYSIVFYDTLGFTSCASGANQSVRNAMWDTTVGWILGYRAQPTYVLSDYVNTLNVIDTTDNVFNYFNSANMNQCVLISDTGVSVNLFNYFLIVLDDYTQNHLNDGLVTTGMPQTILEIPSDVNYVCDPITGEKVMSSVSSGDTTNSLTNTQLYSNNQKILSQKVMSKSYSAGPFVKDIFGIIPLKLTGITAAQVYSEFGGTLQNQDRIYFGPVNIHRMTIKLLSDRGDLVDLNNTNWSFCLMCEQLYKA